MSRVKQQSVRFATLARVVKTFGKEGEVRVRLETESCREASLAILHGTPLWLVPPPPPQIPRLLTAEACVLGHDNTVSMRFKGINDRTVARELVGRDLLVERSDVDGELLAVFDRAQAEQDRATDILDSCIGIQVSTDDGRLLGQIVDVIETGANPVWVVGGERYGEVLLPVIDDCVLDLNLDTRTALVHLMKGLLPDED